MKVRPLVTPLVFAPLMGFAKIPLAQANLLDAIEGRTRTTLTCHSDSHDILIHPDGTKEETRHQGLSSVSVRTVIRKGQLEKRTGEVTTYNADGSIQSVGTFQIRILSENRDGLLVENQEIFTRAEYPQKDGAEPVLRERSTKSESTYRVEGQTRRLLKYVVDGVEKPTRGAVEETLEEVPGRKRVRHSETTPYTEDLSDGYKVEVLKSVGECVEEKRTPF